MIVGGVLAVHGRRREQLRRGGDRRRRGRRQLGGRSSTLGVGDGEVNILNWQGYIDPTEDGAVGTIDRFQEETGIAVTYSEDFNDNNEVYNRISPRDRHRRADG